MADSTKLDILSYLGGIIDGEGSIIISKISDPTSKVLGTYRLVLEVSNTNDKMIEWLYKKFGGSARYVKPTGYHRKEFWNWNVSGKEAEEILRAVRDFSICKEDQIDIALMFRATYSLGTNQYTPPSEEMLRLREELYLKMKALHGEA